MTVQIFVPKRKFGRLVFPLLMITNIIKAYLKERDALETMLSRADAGVGLPSGSMSNGSPGVSDELAQELAEVQSQFNAYKLEIGVDSGRLREDFIAAQREVNGVSAALAKAQRLNF